MRMTIYIFIIVLLGIFTGYFFVSETVDMDIFINITLGVTIFSVGIGIGQNKKLFKDLWKIGLKILVLPFGTIIGSLLGGFLVGFLLNRSIHLSLAIASGFGWYSISAGILQGFAGADVSTIGFLSNVFREMLAFILIPILAKKLSPYAAISVGGATTMDTTLPLVSRSTSEQYAVISFIHGAFLSLIVPFLVPFFAGL